MFNVADRGRMLILELKLKIKKRAVKLFFKRLISRTLDLQINSFEEHSRSYSKLLIRCLTRVLTTSIQIGII